MLRYIIIITFFLFVQCGRSHENKTDKIVKTGINVGEIAPDMAYPGPDGNIISLYSLRGKMVLIDFWASWCPPCRVENPKVVKAYLYYSSKKFKNGDGFTVYSVSCDRTKEDWLKAIEKDSLIWEYHVSDLKGWEAEATYLYKISAIPSNFLIDGNGVILAKNLFGEKLEVHLKELLAE